MRSVLKKEPLIEMTSLMIFIMLYRGIHIQPLWLVLFASDDDIDEFMAV